MTLTKTEETAQVTTDDDMPMWTVTGGFADQSEGPTKAERVQALSEVGAIRHFQAIHPDLPIVRVKADRTDRTLRAWAKDAASNREGMDTIDAEIERLKYQRAQIQRTYDNSMKVIVGRAKRIMMSEVWQRELGNLLEEFGLGRDDFEGYYTKREIKKNDSHDS